MGGGLRTDPLRRCRCSKFGVRGPARVVMPRREEQCPEGKYVGEERAAVVAGRMEL